jgi:hypothetical protein
MGAEALDIVGGKPHPVRAGEIENGLEPEIPVEMAVQVDSRKCSCHPADDTRKR